MKNNNSEIIRRPKIITVLCWVIILYSLLDIAASIMFLANYEKLIEQDYRMKEIFSPGAILSLIIINIPIVIGAIGLFKMKKWGAWVFIGANVILALVRFSYGEQTQYESGISPYIAFIVPGLCIGIVLYFYKYLSDSPYPESKPAANSPTIKPDSSELLSKLEQLHKMKEEGKLSDEEYNIMKNKVMSALTGKVLETKSETKKAEDEISTNKSQTENIVNPVTQTEQKKSEDSGILGKLEQLHKMKEEGMLSDEEYSLMKNKVMSALTGKIVEIKPETKKAEEEILTNTSQTENIVNPVIQTEQKKSEDSGILGKLEQLHKMKEEGMLSENEYHDMKNKIISSIPETQQSSETEVRRTEENKIKPEVSEKTSHTNYPSNIRATNNLSSDSDKVQISKKLIYGSVALLLLAAAFIFIYPKYSQEDDADINKLANYFSDSKQKEEPKKQEVRNSEDKKDEKNENAKSQMTEKNVDSESSVNSNGASNQVKSWIEALGRKDFESAYNLMSPSLSKSYAIFTSTNRYGGIVRTKVHNVETVSSSGCNYVVVASYDSFDPSNRDGKFTERFNVNNCNGTWEITSIKNISVEYYR